MLPAELSITDVAELLGISRERVEERIESGALVAIRPSGNPRGKRFVTLATLLSTYPDLRDSVSARAAFLPSDE